MPKTVAVRHRRTPNFAILTDVFTRIIVIGAKLCRAQRFSGAAALFPRSECVKEISGIACRGLNQDHAAEVPHRQQEGTYKGPIPRPASTPTAKAILSRDDAGKIAMVRAYVVKLEVLAKERTSHEFMHELANRLLKHELPFSEEDLVWLAEHVAATGDFWEWPLGGIVAALERHVARHGLSEQIGQAVERMQANLQDVAFHKAERDLIPRLQELRGKSQPVLHVDSGEPWAKQLLQDIQRMSGPTKDAWSVLLAHAQQSTATKPSAEWLDRAKGLVSTVGADEFVRLVSRWFDRFGLLRTDEPPPELLAEDADMAEVWRYDVSVPNGLLLKGLMWTCRAAPDPRLRSALESLRKKCLAEMPCGKRFAEGATGCRRALESLG